MKANEKKFYVRHHDETPEGMAIYDDPERAYLNLFPISANSDIIALGAEYREYMAAVVPSQKANQYGVGDLIYTDRPEYTEITDTGNATYRVTEILPSLTVSKLFCRRLSDAS